MPKTREVEVYVGYYKGDLQLWDTAYVRIPVDTPEERIETVARERFLKQTTWDDIAFVGLYCDPGSEEQGDDEEDDE